MFIIINWKYNNRIFNHKKLKKGKMASIWSGIGSTLGKQFAKRDAVPFLAGAIGAFLLLPKFAYDESNYAVRYISLFIFIFA